MLQKQEIARSLSNVTDHDNQFHHALPPGHYVQEVILTHRECKYLLDRQNEYQRVIITWLASMNVLLLNSDRADREWHSN